MIVDINEGEKVDRFVDGLKFNVRVEVLKTNCTSFEECARIALNIDSAIWRARRGQVGSYSNSFENSGPTPMEIGNVTRTLRDLAGQRKIDLSRGACFKCHKVACRPWKCGRPKVNNMEGEQLSGEAIVLSDSENE